MRECDWVSWRLDKPGDGVQIDAVIALAMAVGRAQYQPQPARPLGWIGLTASSCPLLSKSSYRNQGRRE